jgi:6-phosphogluconolactonase (cycloisomerase 2 family)
MFMMGHDTTNVYRYNLSTAYDLSSASYTQSFDVSGQDSKPTDVTFNEGGSKMFVVGYKNGNVYSYNLSTAYDLGSASYNQTFDVSGQDGGPTGMTFNGDGTKMFVMGYSTDHVYSYDLSTAYDISSASYNQTFDVSGQDGRPRHVTFNGDGTKMFMVGDDTDSVYSYNVSTSYNLGSVSYNQTFDVSGEDGEPSGMIFNGDGTKMVVVGFNTDTVYRYSTGTEK